MGKWAFLGGFCAVLIILMIAFLVIRKKIRTASRRLFGTENIMEQLGDLDWQGTDQPRSLSGCDSLVMPEILRDFPDFDCTQAKTLARNFLKNKLSQKKDLQIHNIVIAKYLRSEVQKTILFQAAASFRENQNKLQKRYNIAYTYAIAGDQPSVAANCPNCGATLGYGVSVCSYCGSRVVNVMGNTWKFTEITES